MLDSKIIDVLRLYEKTLTDAGHKPERLAGDIKRPGPRGDADHTLWMCVEARRFLEVDLPAAEPGPAQEKVRQKAHRWLGWVQAKLNTLGFFTTDEMKGHNRSNGALPPDDPKDRIFRDVKAERARQDAQWGGPAHDDEHELADWLSYIEQQAGAAYRNDAPRERLVKIAALAVAAIESLDRRSSGL